METTSEFTLETKFKSRFGPVFRGIAAALILCFVGQDLVSAQGGTPIWQNVRNAREARPSEMAGGFSIPSDAGLVRRSALRAGRDHRVINIQDAHQKLGAQESIARILENLVRNYDLKLIAVEGGSSRIDTSLVGAFPVEKARRQVGAYLLREGKLSASEFYAMISEKPVSVYGVEDPELYGENVDTFRRIVDRKVAVRAQLKSLTAVLKELETAIYPAELRALAGQKFLNRAGDIKFTDYWKTYSAAAAERGVDYRKHPNLAKLAGTIELEAEIDFKAAEGERAQLLDELGKKLAKEDLQALLLQALQYKQNKSTAGEFHYFLSHVSERAGIEPGKYPNLIRYAEYAVMYEGVDLVAIFEEVEAFEEELKASFFTADDERALDRLARGAAILTQLLDTTLSSKDYEFFLKNREACEAAAVEAEIRRLADAHGVAVEGRVDFEALQEALPDARQFYELADRRNRTLFQNTVARMKSENVRVAALVTGGFHTDGISRLMEDDKLSYLVVMPKFDDKSPDRPYIAILTKKPREFEQQFKDSDFYLAPPQYFESMTREQQIESVALLLRAHRALDAAGELPAELKDRRVLGERYAEAYGARLATVTTVEREGRLTPEDIVRLTTNGRIQPLGDSIQISFDDEGLAFLMKKSSDGRGIEGPVGVTRGGAKEASPRAEAAPVQAGNALAADRFAVILRRATADSSSFFNSTQNNIDEAEVKARMLAAAERWARAGGAQLTPGQVEELSLAAKAIANRTLQAAPAVVQEPVAPPAVTPKVTEPAIIPFTLQSPLRAPARRIAAARLAFSQFGLEELEPRRLMSGFAGFEAGQAALIGSMNPGQDTTPAIEIRLTAAEAAQYNPGRSVPSDATDAALAALMTEPYNFLTSPSAQKAAQTTVPLAPLAPGESTVLEDFFASYGRGLDFLDGVYVGKLGDGDVSDPSPFAAGTAPLSEEPAAQDFFGQEFAPEAEAEPFTPADVTAISDELLADANFRQLWQIPDVRDDQTEGGVRDFLGNLAVEILRDSRLAGLTPVEREQFMLNNVFAPQLRILNEAGADLEAIQNLPAGSLRQAFDWQVLTRNNDGSLTPLGMRQAIVVEASQSYRIDEFGYRDSGNRINIDTGEVFQYTIAPGFDRVDYVINDIHLQRQLLDDARFGKILELYGLDRSQTQIVSQVLGDLVSQIRGTVTIGGVPVDYRTEGLRFTNFTLAQPDSGETGTYTLTLTNGAQVLDAIEKQLTLVNNTPVYDFIREVYGLRNGAEELQGFRGAGQLDVRGQFASQFVRQAVAENADSIPFWEAALDLRDTLRRPENAEAAGVYQEVFGIDVFNMDERAIRLLGDPAFGILYRGPNQLRDVQQSVDFAIAVDSLRDEVSTNSQAAQIYIEVFGINFQQPLTVDAINKLGDPALGLLYRGPNELRNTKQAVAFAVAVDNLRDAVFTNGQAAQIYIEAFGIDFQRPLTVDAINKLGDPALGLLYRGPNELRDTQQAVEFAVAVDNLRDAVARNDQAAVIYREVFGIDFQQPLTIEAINKLGDATLGLLYTGPNQLRNTQQAVEFAVAVDNLRDAVFTNGQAAQIYIEAFGIDFQRPLTIDAINKLGDPALGLLYRGPNQLRNPDEAVAFAVAVDNFRDVIRPDAQASGIYREVFGIDFDQPLTAEAITKLGDPVFGILFRGPDQLRSPEEARDFAIAVDSFRDLILRPENDQALELFQEVFQINLRDGIDFAELGVFAGNKGILYDETGALRSAEETVEFYNNVEALRDRIEQSADRDAVEDIFARAYGVDFRNGVDETELARLGSKTSGILFNADGQLRSTEKMVQVLEMVAHFNARDEALQVRDTAAFAKVNEILQILGVDTSRGLITAENIRVLADEGVLFKVGPNGELVERDHATTLKFYEFAIDLRNGLQALNKSDSELAQKIDNMFFSLYGFRLLDGIQKFEIPLIANALFKEDGSLRDPAAVLKYFKQLVVGGGGSIFISSFGAGIGGGGGSGGSGSGVGVGSGGGGGGIGPSALEPIKGGFMPPSDMIDFDFVPPVVPDVEGGVVAAEKETYEKDLAEQEREIAEMADRAIELAQAALDWLDSAKAWLRSWQQLQLPVQPGEEAAPASQERPAELAAEPNSTPYQRYILYGLTAIAILLAARAALKARRDKRKLDEKEAELLRRIEEALRGQPVPVEVPLAPPTEQAQPGPSETVPADGRPAVTLEANRAELDRTVTELLEWSAKSDQSFTTPYMFTREADRLLEKARGLAGHDRDAQLGELEAAVRRRESELKAIRAEKRREALSAMLATVAVVRAAAAQASGTDIGRRAANRDSLDAIQRELVQIERLLTESREDWDRHAFANLNGRDSAQDRLRRAIGILNQRTGFFGSSLLSRTSSSDEPAFQRLTSGLESLAAELRGFDEFVLLDTVRPSEGPLAPAVTAPSAEERAAGLLRELEDLRKDQLRSPWWRKLFLFVVAPILFTTVIATGLAGEDLAGAKMNAANQNVERQSAPQLTLSSYQRYGLIGLGALAALLAARGVLKARQAKRALNEAEADLLRRLEEELRGRGEPLVAPAVVPGVPESTIDVTDEVGPPVQATTTPSAQERVGELQKEVAKLRGDYNRSSWWRKFLFVIAAPILLSVVVLTSLNDKGAMMDKKAVPVEKQPAAVVVQPQIGKLAPPTAPKAEEKKKAAAPYSKQFLSYRLQLNTQTPFETKARAAAAETQAKAKEIDEAQSRIASAEQAIFQSGAELEKLHEEWKTLQPKKADPALAPRAAEVETRMKAIEAGFPALYAKLGEARAQYYEKLGDPFRQELSDVTLQMPIDAIKRKATLLRGMITELKAAPEGREAEIRLLGEQATVAENLAKSLESKRDQVVKLRDDARKLLQRAMADVVTSYSAMGGLRADDKQVLRYSFTIQGKKYDVAEPLGRSRFPNEVGYAPIAYAVRIRLGVDPKTGDFTWGPVLGSDGKPMQYSHTAVPAEIVKGFQNPASPWFYQDTTPGPYFGTWLVRHGSGAPVIVDVKTGKIEGQIKLNFLEKGYEIGVEPGSVKEAPFYSTILPFDGDLLELTEEQWRARKATVQRTSSGMSTFGIIQFIEDKGRYYVLTRGEDSTELTTGVRYLLTPRQPGDGGIAIETTYYDYRTSKSKSGVFTLDTKNGKMMVGGTRRTFGAPYQAPGLHRRTELYGDALFVGGSSKGGKTRGTGLYVEAGKIEPSQSAFEATLRGVEARKQAVLAQIRATGGTQKLSNELDRLAELALLFQNGPSVVTEVAVPGAIPASFKQAAAGVAYGQRAYHAFELLDLVLSQQVVPPDQQVPPILEPITARQIALQSDPSATAKDTPTNVAPAKGIPLKAPREELVAPDRVFAPMLAPDAAGKHREPLGQGWLRTWLRENNLEGRFGQITVLDGGGTPLFHLSGDVKINGVPLTNVDFEKTPLQPTDKIEAGYVTRIIRDPDTGSPTGSITSTLKPGAFTYPQFNPERAELFPVGVDIRQPINLGKVAGGTLDLFEVRTYARDSAGNLVLKDGQAQYTAHFEYRFPNTHLFASVYGDARLDIRDGKVVGVQKSPSGRDAIGEVEVVVDRRVSRIFPFDTAKGLDLPAAHVATFELEPRKALFAGATHDVIVRRSAATGHVEKIFAVSDAVGERVRYFSDVSGRMEALDVTTGNIYTVTQGYDVGELIATTEVGGTVTANGKTYELRIRRSNIAEKTIERVFAVDLRGNEAVRYYQIAGGAWEAEVVETGTIHAVNAADYSLGAQTGTIQATGQTVTIAGVTYTIKVRRSMDGQIQQVLGFDRTGREAVRYFPDVDGRLSEAEHIATGDIYRVADPVTFAVGDKIAQTERPGNVMLGPSAYSLRVRKDMKGNTERVYALDAFGREALRYFLDPDGRAVEAEDAATGNIYAVGEKYAIGAQVGTTQNLPGRLTFDDKAYDVKVQTSLEGTVRRVFAIDRVGREVGSFFPRPQTVDGNPVAGLFVIDRGQTATQALPAGVVAAQGYKGNEPARTLYYAGADYSLRPALGIKGYAVKTETTVRFEGKNWPITEELDSKGRFLIGRALDAAGVDRATVTLMPEGIYQVEVIAKDVKDIAPDAKQQLIRTGYLAKKDGTSFVVERDVIRTSYVSTLPVTLERDGSPQGLDRLILDTVDIPVARRAMAQGKLDQALRTIAVNLGLKGKATLIKTEVLMSNGSRSFFYRVKEDPFARILIYRSSDVEANVVINTDWEQSSGRKGYEFSALGQVYLQEASAPTMTSQGVIDRYELAKMRSELEKRGVKFPTEPFSEITRSLLVDGNENLKVAMDVRYLLPNDANARDFLRVSRGSARFILWSLDPQVPFGVAAGEVVAIGGSQNTVLRQTQFVSWNETGKEYVYRLKTEYRDGREYSDPDVLIGFNYGTGAVWEHYVHEEWKLYSKDGFPLFIHRVAQAEGPVNAPFSSHPYAGIDGKSYGLHGSELRHSTFNTKTWTHPTTGDVYMLTSEKFETQTPFYGPTFFLVKNGDLAVVIEGEGANRQVHIDPYGDTFRQRGYNSLLFLGGRTVFSTLGGETIEGIADRIGKEGRDVPIQALSETQRQSLPVYFSPMKYAMSNWWFIALLLAGGAASTIGGAKLLRRLRGPSETIAHEAGDIEALDEVFRKMGEDSPKGARLALNPDLLEQRVAPASLNFDVIGAVGSETPFMITISLQQGQQAPPTVVIPQEVLDVTSPIAPTSGVAGGIDWAAISQGQGFQLQGAPQAQLFFSGSPLLEGYAADLTRSLNRLDLRAAGQVDDLLQKLYGFRALNGVQPQDLSRLAALLDNGDGTYKDPAVVVESFRVMARFGVTSQKELDEVSFMLAQLDYARFLENNRPATSAGSTEGASVTGVGGLGIEIQSLNGPPVWFDPETGEYLIKLGGSNYHFSGSAGNVPTRMRQTGSAPHASLAEYEWVPQIVADAAEALREAEVQSYRRELLRQESALQLQADTIVDTLDRLMSLLESLPNRLTGVLRPGFEPAPVISQAVPETAGEEPTAAAYKNYVYAGLSLIAALLIARSVLKKLQSTRPLTQKETDLLRRIEEATSDSVAAPEKPAVSESKGPSGPSVAGARLALSLAERIVTTKELGSNLVIGVNVPESERAGLIFNHFKNNLGYEDPEARKVVEADRRSRTGFRGFLTRLGLRSPLVSFDQVEQDAYRYPKTQPLTAANAPAEIAAAAGLKYPQAMIINELLKDNLITAADISSAVTAAAIGNARGDLLWRRVQTALVNLAQNRVLANGLQADQVEKLPDTPESNLLKFVFRNGTLAANGYSQAQLRALAAGETSLARFVERLVIERVARPQMAAVMAGTYRGQMPASVEADVLRAVSAEVLPAIHNDPSLLLQLATTGDMAYHPFPIGKSVEPMTIREHILLKLLQRSPSETNNHSIGQFSAVWPYSLYVVRRVNDLLKKGGSQADVLQLIDDLNGAFPPAVKRELSRYKTMTTREPWKTDEEVGLAAIGKALSNRARAQSKILDEVEAALMGRPGVDNVLTEIGRRLTAGETDAQILAGVRPLLDFSERFKLVDLFSELDMWDLFEFVQRQADEARARGEEPLTLEQQIALATGKPLRTLAQLRAAATGTSSNAKNEAASDFKKTTLALASIYNPEAARADIGTKRPAVFRKAPFYAGLGLAIIGGVAAALGLASFPVTMGLIVLGLGLVIATQSFGGTGLVALYAGRIFAPFFSLEKFWGMGPSQKAGFFFFAAAFVAGGVAIMILAPKLLTLGILLLILAPALLPIVFSSMPLKEKLFWGGIVMGASTVYVGGLLLFLLFGGAILATVLSYGFVFTALLVAFTYPVTIISFYHVATTIRSHLVLQREVWSTTAQSMVGFGSFNPFRGLVGMLFSKRVPQQERLANFIKIAIPLYLLGLFVISAASALTAFGIVALGALAIGTGPFTLLFLAAAIPLYVVYRYLPRGNGPEYWENTFGKWFKEVQFVEINHRSPVPNGESVAEYMERTVRRLNRSMSGGRYLLSDEEARLWIDAINGRPGGRFVRPSSPKAFEIMRLTFFTLSQKKVTPDNWALLQASSTHVQAAGELFTHTAENSLPLGTFNNGTSLLGYVARNQPHEWLNLITYLAQSASANVRAIAPLLAGIDERTDIIELLNTSPLSPAERQIVYNEIVRWLNEMRPNNDAVMDSMAQDFVEYHMMLAYQSGDLGYRRAVRNVGQDHPSLAEAYRVLSGRPAGSLNDDEAFFVERYASYQERVDLKLRGIFQDAMLWGNFRGQTGGLNLTQISPVEGLITTLEGYRDRLPAGDPVRAEAERFIAELRAFDPRNQTGNPRFATIEQWSEDFLAWRQTNFDRWMFLIRKMQLPTDAPLVPVGPGEQRPRDFMNTLVQSAETVLKGRRSNLTVAFHDFGQDNFLNNAPGKHQGIALNLKYFFGTTVDFDAHVMNEHGQQIYRPVWASMNSRLRNPQFAAINPMMSVWASSTWAFPATWFYSIAQVVWTSDVQRAIRGKALDYGKYMGIPQTIGPFMPPGEDSEGLLMLQRSATRPGVFYTGTQIDWFSYRWGRPSLFSESLVTTEMRYAFNVTRFMMDRGSFAVFHNPNVPTEVKLTHIFLWFHYFIAPFALTLLVLLPALSPFSAFAFLKPLMFFVGTSYILMEAINLNNLNRHWRETGSFWQAVYLMLRDAILALPFYVFLIPFFFRGILLASLEMFSFLRTVKEAFLSSWNERQRYEELMLLKLTGPRGIPFNGLVGIAGLIAWTIGLVFMTPLAPIILLPYLLASIAFLTGMYVIDSFEHGPKKAGLLYGYSFWAMFTRLPSVIGRTYRHLRTLYSAEYRKDKYLQKAKDRAVAQGVKSAEVNPSRPISVDEIEEIVQGRKAALASAEAVKARLRLTDDLAPKTTAELKIWTATQQVAEQVASGTRFSLAAARLAAEAEKTPERIRAEIALRGILNHPSNPERFDANEQVGRISLMAIDAFGVMDRDLPVTGFSPQLTLALGAGSALPAQIQQEWFESEHNDLISIHTSLMQAIDNLATGPAPAAYALNVLRNARTSLAGLREDTVRKYAGVLSEDALRAEFARFEELLDGRIRVLEGNPRLAEGSVAGLLERNARAVHDRKHVAAEVRFTIAPDLGNAVYDDAALSKLVSELVSNALNFAVSAVTINARREGGRIVIEVVDDGPGIAEDVLPKIFEYGVTTRTTGTGMGLAEVAELSRFLGAEVRAGNRTDGALGGIFTVSLPVRPEGARLAAERAPAESPAYLRPVTVGIAAAPDEFAAREAALRDLLGRELSAAFRIERLDAVSAADFAGAAEAGTFRVLVDASAFETNNTFSNPAEVLENLVGIAQARQTRVDAVLARQEAVMALIAELAPDARAAAQVDDAVLALKLGELQKALAAIDLPELSRYEPVRTTAGLQLFTDGRQVAPLRIDEEALAAHLATALASQNDADKIDAARRALSLVLDAIGEPAGTDYAARARDAIRTVLASYSALMSQQTLFAPTDVIEGEKTVAVMESMFAGNEAEYNREAAYLLARNREMKLAIIVPMTDAWRAVGPVEREDEYRRLHPEAGAFRIVFSENAASLEGIGRDIQGPFVLAGREEIALGAPDTTREALLMQLDGKAKTHTGVLVVAAKVLYGGREIAIPGLEKLGEGIFRYLPAISPLELFRLLREANASFRAIGAAA